MNVIKRKQVFAVFLVLTLLWMAVIYGFSSNNAEDSTVQSNGVTELFARIFIPGFEELTEQEKQDIISRYDGPVRKLAHFVSYGILGALACASAVTCPIDTKRVFTAPLVSASACVVFAVSDEYHQTFVEGRAGQLKDILIDSAGVLCGTAVMFLILMYISKRIDNNKGKEV